MEGACHLWRDHGGWWGPKGRPEHPTAHNRLLLLRLLLLLLLLLSIALCWPWRPEAEARNWHAGGSHLPHVDLGPSHEWWCSAAFVCHDHEVHICCAIKTSSHQLHLLTVV